MTYKCSICGGKLRLVNLNVGKTDSYVCEECFHVEFYANQAIRDNIKEEIAKAAAALAAKKDLETSKRTLALKKGSLEKKIQDIKKQINDINKEIKVLQKNANDDSITVKQHKDFLSQAEMKKQDIINLESSINDTQMKIADINQELKRVTSELNKIKA